MDTSTCKTTGKLRAGCKCHNCRSARSAKKKYVALSDGGQRPSWRVAHPERFMWLQSKHHALKLGVPFSILPSDIIIPKVCPILGMPLVQFGGRDSAPSLDRIVCELGYTKENIQVISGRANRIKSDASLEELIKITEHLKCLMPQT